MSGVANGIGSNSGMVRGGFCSQDIQTITVYHTPTQANSANTDAFATFDGVRSYTVGYQSWFSYSGADVTLQKGVYFIHFTFTIDYIGSGTGFHHKMFARDSGTSSPGKIICNGYGNAAGVHTNFPPMHHILTCDVATIIKVSTRETGDGHSLYDGTNLSTTIQAPYSFLTIVKFPHGASQQTISSSV